jgi:hypothetical protein
MMCTLKVKVTLHPRIWYKQSVYSRRGQKFLCSPKRPEILESTQHPIQWEPYVLPNGQSGRRATYLVPGHRITGQKPWLPVFLTNMLRDNFTFPFYTTNLSYNVATICPKRVYLQHTFIEPWSSCIQNKCSASCKVYFILIIALCKFGSLIFGLDFPHDCGACVHPPVSKILSSLQLFVVQDMYKYK